MVKDGLYRKLNSQRHLCVLCVSAVSVIERLFTSEDAKVAETARRKSALVDAILRRELMAANQKDT
jgi:hypothetical protein